MSFTQASDPTLIRTQRSQALARNWGAIVVRGVIAVVLGVVAFIAPAVTLGTLVLVFGIYALVDGVFAIVAALRAATHHERWSLLALEGLFGIVAGLVAIFLPVLTIYIAVTVMAVWAVITGALMIVAAFRLHLNHGAWMLGLGGAVSLLWGGLLFAMPASGAVVLTLWLGAYALVFGISMISLGLRLRSRHGAVAV